MRRTLLALVAVVLVPLVGGVASAQTSPGSYERVVDITFPVAGDVRYSNDYHADRGGGTRIHQATDIMGRKLQPLHAAVDGEICYINGVDEPMPSWGYSITLCGDDGLDYRYIHINNDSPGTDDGLGGPEWAYAPGIRKGVRVSRGQWVAYMGDSGNAEGTPPHLHFEIFDRDMVDPELAREKYKQGRLNPFASLQEARRRGDLPAGADVARGVRRLAGVNRVETAVALSRERGRATTVIIAPAETHAEALVAAPLAGMLDAPVLLTPRLGLDYTVAAEVNRLGARNAYIIGRTDQVAAQVEADLADAGVTALARLEAPDALQLSAVVAREMATYPVMADGFDRVFLALGTSADPSRAWPDALSVSALAAELRAPILLTGQDGLPAAVADVLAEFGPETVSVVGGTVAISDEIAGVAEQASGGEVERLAGPDRYGTSVAIAEEARRVGMDGTIAWLATGLNFPDALAAGPAAARTGAPLLLVHGMSPGGSPDSEAWLTDEASTLDGAVVVGGIEAVTEAVREEIARTVGRQRMNP